MTFFSCANLAKLTSKTDGIVYLAKEYFANRKYETGFNCPVLKSGDLKKTKYFLLSSGNHYAIAGREEEVGQILFNPVLKHGATEYMVKDTGIGSIYFTVSKEF